MRVAMAEILGQILGQLRKQEVLELLRKQEEVRSAKSSIEHEAYQIALKVANLRQEYEFSYGNVVRPMDEGFELDGGSVSFAWDAYSRGNYMGQESFCYPLEYLWTANYLEVERAQLEQGKANKLEQIRQEAKEREQAREKKEKAEFERLKQKYGGSK
jgi:hypothetical protein